MSVDIHPSAIVSPEAQIGENVKIGAFSIIGPNVSIASACVIGSQVHIDGHTEIGENNIFHSFSSIGAPPQDASYKGEPTRTVIGRGNTFREYVSIHRGTLKDKGITKIGDNSLFMAYVHLGHDVQFGSNCVVANSTNFAGHVNIGDRVIIGGGSQISQFVSIGRGAYIGGATAIDRDIPIFCTAYGNRVKLRGVNIIGMRRQGVDKTAISEVVDFYRTMEASALSQRAFVDHEEHMTEFRGNPIINEMVEFIRASEVGIAPFL